MRPAPHPPSVAHKAYHYRSGCRSGDPSDSPCAPKRQTLGNVPPLGQCPSSAITTLSNRWPGAARPQRGKSDGAVEIRSPPSAAILAVHEGYIAHTSPGHPSSFSRNFRGLTYCAEDSFLTIDHSGVLWVATANGLVRFDREREQFTIYDERDGLPASVRQRHPRRSQREPCG